MDEQELKKYDEIMARMDQGMSEYQAINYNTLPQNPIPFKQYVSYVNTQNEIETEHKLAKSFYNGTISMINGLIGTGRMLVDSRLSYEAQEGEAAGMAGVGSVTIDELRKPTKLLQRYNVQANTTAEKLIYGLAEGGAQLVGQALVTLATGGIGGGFFMGAQIAGNQYNELRNEGVDPDRAFEASVTNALVQTPLEQLAFGKIMKALPANSKLKAKLYKVAEDFITEGVTEGLQSLPEQLTNIWAKNNGIDALGVAREWDKNASEYIKDMVYSGIIGSILGAGAGGIRIGISTAIEKSFTNYQNKNIEANAENAKKNGMSAQQTQQSVDLYDRGETAVNIDAQQVLSYAQTQQVDVEKVATSLGVTASEIEDAAEAGLDITVSKGHMVQAMMEQNGFSEAIIPHVSYGDQGKSLNYYQMQEEMSKAYGEGSEAMKALDEELNSLEQSMLDAGVAKQQAKDARALANAFAVSMAPENPAEFLKKYKLRFANEGKVKGNNGSLFQTAPAIESQEFKAWFGNSKAVDESGKPIVFYRGISEEYNADKQGDVVWISPDKAQADSYRHGGAGSEVLQLYAKVENPIFVGDSFTQMTVSNFVNKIIPAVDTAFEQGKITEQQGLTLFDKLEDIQRNDDGKYSAVYQIYNSRQDLVDIIKELGFDAIATTENGNMTYGVFGRENVKAVNNEGSFNPASPNIYNQSQQGEYKGSFTPQADGSFVISMFKNGDASTVIHETGHYFFEVFMQESGLDTASDKLKADRKAFLEYVGMTEEQWAAADFEGRRAAHERIATAFEQYLLEGKAPSRGLRGVFDRFSKWLKKIYGEVVQSPDYQEVPDNVRQAFDHWLAADADLEEAARMQGFYSKLDNKLTANLSPEKKKWLEEKIYSAHQTAVEMLTKQYMRNFRPERQAEIEQYRKDMEEVVRNRVHEYRVNQARAAITDVFTKEVEKTFRFKLFSDAKVKYNVQVVGRPIQVANRYLNWLNYDKGREEAYKSVQNEIDAAIKPGLEMLQEGFGVRSRVAYIDTATGQEISFDEAQSRDKASPGYVTRFVSENAPWYQKWFAEHHRQPTKAELLKLAEDLYCGIDEYGVYGDLMKAHSAKQQDELDAFEKEQRQKLKELYAERDRLQKDDKYLGKDKRPKLTDDEAIDFEELAEDLGYSSGSEMAQDILNAKSENAMVREELNKLVDEAYPDYAKEKAEKELAIIEALNNDKQGEVLALEQQLIEEAAQTAFVAERSQQARMALAREQKAKAEVTADKLINAMSMGEAMNIRHLAMQERRAAAKAKKALKEGNFEEASEYKRQQMIAHAMVRKSAAIRQEVKSFEKKVKKFYNLRKDSKAGDNTTFFRNWGSEENFMQIANLLMRISPDYKRSDYDPKERKQTLAEYVADMTEKYSDMVVDISENVTNENVDISNKKSMSYELFNEVKEALENLEKIVRHDKKSIIDGKAQDAAKVRQDWLDNANAQKDIKVKRDASGKVQRNIFRSIEASMMTLDNLVKRMDGWKPGYFTNTIIPMIKHCGDKYYNLLEGYKARAQAASAKWLKDKAARIAAFEQRHYEELGTSTNKLVLVKMAANLGNEGNARVLCGTRPAIAQNSKLWVIAGENNDLTQDEAIALTRQNLVNFLSKNLTKSDIEYAQSLIDNCEASWPELAKVNIDSKGYAPEKVRATPVAFTLANGEVVEMRGGYIPLVRDTSIDRPQSQDVLQGTENSRYSNVATMSTNKTSSKKRTGATYAIDLSATSEYFSMEQTFRDIAYREAIIEFNRLFKDKEVWNTLVRKYGQEHMRALVECISKCANPYSNTGADMAEDIFGRFLNNLRRSTVSAIVAWNLKIDFQNFANLPLYANAVEGYTLTDVMSTIPDIFRGYKHHIAMREEVFELSPFMRQRAEASDITMKEYLDAYESGIDKGGHLAEFNHFLLKTSAKMLEVTDNITAVPNWLNAYRKKLNSGASQQEAIDYADTLIRRTLGSTRIEDVSSYQRGSKMYRLLTSFQGFFNTQLNQWLDMAHKTGRMIDDKEFKRAFWNVASFLMTKYFLACTLTILCGFENPFGEDKKGWKNISKELINYPLSMGGIGGQIANAAISRAFDMQNYGYKLSIVENAIERGLSLSGKVGDVFEGKREIKDLGEPFFEMVSIMTGAPLQFVRTGYNVVDWLEDDINWEMADFIRRRPKSERNKNP